MEGGRIVYDWLWKLFNVCWISGEVLDDWKEAVIVPLYKGKGYRNECGNYRGISVLSGWKSLRENCV